MAEATAAAKDAAKDVCCFKEQKGTQPVLEYIYIVVIVMFVGLLQQR